MKTLLIILVSALCTFAQTPLKHLTVNDTVPFFSLPDQDNKVFNYKDVKAKGIWIIFFYTKDNANISAKQVQGFKNHIKEFEEEGAFIVGINTGSSESHKKFHSENQLPFPLLSDVNSTVVNQFGIKTIVGGLNRETYVIDYTGRIVFHLDSYLDGAKHADEALKYIKSQD